MLKFTPLIASLPSTVPFVGPEALERLTGSAVKARIGANENVFGPAPSVIQALREHAHQSWMYGDPENHDLKIALAAHLNVGPENICAGEGIDALLGYGLRLFVEQGTPVATSQGAYPTFNFHVASLGGHLLTTPYVDSREHPPSVLALAAREKAKVIYFANPDNPMGTVWPAADVQRLINAVPEDVILMLDEAYTEFAGANTRPPVDVARRNVLRFRTFSKAYGLAGMRVGYVIGHREVIAAFDKVRNHFGVGRLSQVAALAALKDQDWLHHVVSEVQGARQRIAEIARSNGLGPIPSSTNFVAVDCGRDGAYAKEIVENLLHHGIFVRMPAVAPLNRCIRISCGTPQDLYALEQALPKVVLAQ